MQVRGAIPAHATEVMQEALAAAVPVATTATLRAGTAAIVSGAVFNEGLGQDDRCPTRVSRQLRLEIAIDGIGSRPAQASASVQTEQHPCHHAGWPTRLERADVPAHHFDLERWKAIHVTVSQAL